MSKESLQLPSDLVKRVQALVEALRSAIDALAADDPRIAREAVQCARDRLDEAEGAAIRAALERCHWRVKPAADLLGFRRHSALQKLLEPGRRHEAIGKELERQREESGYRGGRPPLPAAEPATVGQKAPPRRRRSAPHG
jgi:DNA-binding NtrC family response regulator